MPNNQRTLHYAVHGLLGELKPARQSTALADILLSAGFEPLTIDNGNGFYSAGIAKEWRVSEDRRQVTFWLNLDKRFSDGSPISSFLYKESMLESLRQTPIYKNQATRDVLYALVGFMDFEHSGDIVGIKTPDVGTLIFEFERPYRDILMEISGIRYSIFKIGLQGQHLGTGPFCFSKVTEQHISLQKNPYYLPAPSIETIEIDILDRNSFETAICEEAYDMILIPPFVSPSNICKNKSNGFTNRYEEIPGKIDTHLFLTINTKGNNVLSDIHTRQLFQRYFYSNINQLQEFEKYKTKTDIQFFLPSQPGRLSEQDIVELTAITNDEIHELIETINRKPLFIFKGVDQNSRFHDFVALFLQQLGIAITPASRILSYQEYKNIETLNDPWDFYYRSVGIGCDDPDGLYHLFGTHGALARQSLEGTNVQYSIEKARSLLNFEELHNAYQEVNRAIYSEVPAIHLGYSSASMLYNHRKLTFKGRGASMFFLQNYSWR